MADQAKHLTRMPRDLYKAVQAEAAKQGVSANALIVAIIAGALGYRKK